MTDQQLAITALRQAQLILADHVEPGPRESSIGPAQTRSTRRRPRVDKGQLRPPR